MNRMLKAPFPYFGGKSRVAGEVWARFGNPRLYIEPFCGSAAVLLARPSKPGRASEIINDIDGYVTNFWRAAKAEPDKLAELLEWPVNEIDMLARHDYLKRPQFRTDLVEKLRADPRYFDVEMAAWWCWGKCAWMGSGWCCNTKHNRMLPELTIRRGVLGKNDTLQWIHTLANRLVGVAICCNDWAAVLRPSVISNRWPVAVFLDPPYAEQIMRARRVYVDNDVSLSAKVREWAVEHGRDRRYRIALCGYEGEHDMPDDWECYAWKAPGGFGNQNKRKNNTNRFRERIWFSPGCLQQSQGLINV